MIDLSAYPKKKTITEDIEVTIRTLEPSDEEALFRFMLDLPPAERVHFRDDVTDPSVIHDWATNIDLDRVIPLLATVDGAIIANWSLHHREYGWTRHQAHIRGIVHPKWRTRGLGALMVYELLSIGKNLHFERIVIELVAPQKELLLRYKKIGFKTSAVLKKWVKDFRGRYHDIHVLSTELEPAWKKMEAMILDYGTHGG